MAKRNKLHNRKTQNTPQDLSLEDYDYSSDNCDIYTPTADDADNLVVDDDAYKTLEYIDLEWPSMSIDAMGPKFITGTFPPDPTDGCEIVEITFKELASAKPNSPVLRMKPPIFKEYRIPWLFNKIRIINNEIFGISKRTLVKLDDDYTPIKEIRGSYRYGLSVSPKYVMVGCTSGSIKIYNHDLEFIRKIPSGQDPIECVAFDSISHPSIISQNLRTVNERRWPIGGEKGTVRLTAIDPARGPFTSIVPAGIIASGSLDHTVRLFNIRGELIGLFNNDTDINAIDIRGGYLIFGDDSGKIHLVDLAGGKKEVIEWHKTAISFVRWRDDDVFLSGSDEQVCVWDKSIVDDDTETGVNNDLSVTKSDDLSVIKSGQGDDTSSTNTSTITQHSTQQGNNKDSGFPKYLMFVHQGQVFYKDCAFYENMVIVTSQGGLCIFEPISSVE